MTGEVKDAAELVRFVISPEGQVTPDIAGKLPGRTRDDQITVFKSLGTAVQDLVLGDRLLARSARSRIGVSFARGAD